MGWYRRIKPNKGRSARSRYAVRGAGQLTQRVRTPVRVRKPEFIFYKKYSSSVYLEGYRVKVVSRFQIAKFFDVPLPMITKWSDKGVLPEPFLHMQRGGVKYPVYLAAQIRCLIKVVNDLVEDGYVSIRWASLPEHVDMLYDGYDETFKAFQKRAGYLDEDDDTDRFGVALLD